MTTAGLGAAFRRLGHHVEIFHPFDYPGTFFSTPWDLVIIEGWFLSINSFIHEARRVTPLGPASSMRAHGPVILFWCLDPAFPGLQTLANLDLDGIMSNSPRALAEINALSGGIIHNFN